jgi:uncharacterized sulfatase
VPFIIAGPKIRGSQVSEVMVNGLDFYPTILSWTNTKLPQGVMLDGCDLRTLLEQNPRNAKLVKDTNGKVRDTMIWHFPHGVAQESSIRVNGWKLIYNYMAKGPTLQLFNLYENYPDNPKRVDIEESVNLASKFPEKAKDLEEKLFMYLNEMKASYPHFNPHYKNHLAHKENVPTGVESGINGNTAWAKFIENGSTVKRAQIAYTLNGGEKSEEWFLVPADLSGNLVKAEIPTGTTHYLFNFIDENNFLVSFPDVPEKKLSGREKIPYSKSAIPMQAD